MYICSLCGLELEKIPTDAVRIGNVYRFRDGSFHFLRKKVERKTSGHGPVHKAPTEKG